MNRILYAGLMLCLGFVSTLAQTTPVFESTLFHNNRVEFRNDPVTANPDWAPFFHGVASGDPLSDRVIIWTRVTPEDMNTDPIEVKWTMATDPQLMNQVADGTFTTDADRDYTVKIDVTDLAPATTYYYGFEALGKASLTGRTKTTPEFDQADHLRFGVVSCSNFQAGYFNGYAGLAARNDLDAVIHLGDYIYEYADGVYGDADLFADRPLEPSTEIVTEEEYRTRYSTYRLDTALARAHQQHPFIAVWDDHESANDAYTDGAENHDPATQGDWETRKNVAKKVYFEWMPIREQANDIVYRTIQYGDLCDLIMLDTRLEGREVQILDNASPDLQDPDRTILGADQKDWFLDQLSSSEAKWKVIGQQVIFAEFHVGWAGLADPAGYHGTESIFLDIWDGYPAERAQIIDFIETNEIDNVVMLTGDFHSTFAFDVPTRPHDLLLTDVPGVGLVPFYNATTEYDPTTGDGSVLVEFATPSITSANFDENIDPLTAFGLQVQINSDVDAGGGLLLGNPNPHLKGVNLVQHGYFILDVQEEATTANWYFTPIDEVSADESFEFAFFTNDGENRLQPGDESEGKDEQDEPAPSDPPAVVNNVNELSNFTLLGASPNPFIDLTTLNYSLAEKADVRIQLVDTDGKVLQTLVDETLPAGQFTLRSNGADLPAGMYYYSIQVDGELQTIPVVKGN